MRPTRRSGGGSVGRANSFIEACAPAENDEEDRHCHTRGAPRSTRRTAKDLSRSASRRPAKVTIPFGNESRQSILELRQPLTAVRSKDAICRPHRSKP